MPSVYDWIAPAVGGRQGKCLLASGPKKPTYVYAPLLLQLSRLHVCGRFLFCLWVFDTLLPLSLGCGRSPDETALHTTAAKDSTDVVLGPFAPLIFAVLGRPCDAAVTKHTAHSSKCQHARPPRLHVMPVFVCTCAEGMQHRLCGRSAVGAAGRWALLRPPLHLRQRSRSKRSCAPRRKLIGLR